jgi:serine/threonine protein kinase
MSVEWKDRLNIRIPIQISDRYDIIKILSSSSNKKVVLVKDKTTLMSAIIKIIKKDRLQNKELYILNKISEFKGIMAPVDSFDLYNMEILIFPYYEKGDLFDSSLRNMSEDYLRIITKQIIDILEHLKYKHIIHLDIKPDNILLGNDEKIVLIDFDLSQVILECGMYANDYVGTFPYIAPEIFSKYFYTHKADLWSLGMTLLTCVINKRIFMKDEYIAYCECEFETDSIIQLKKSNISKHGQDFILSLLKINPLDRPEIEQCKQHPWILNVINPYDIVDTQIKPKKRFCGFFRKK